MYTVKQLSDLADISVRTLHYYDEIDLLKPAKVRENGYRYYDDGNLLQLQQILFYREMGLELKQIKAILNEPEFDTLAALQTHRRTLQAKIERLHVLIQTVESTIMHLIGEVKMSKEKVFDGFTKKQQEQYEKEAIENWGDEAAQSIKRWHALSDERKAEILQEGTDIYTEIAASMEKGAGSAEIRALLVRWHRHLEYFYEPSIEILESLGRMYHDHPDFNATFTAFHPNLPAFLKEAIAIYTDELATAWLKRELGILEE